MASSNLNVLKAREGEFRHLLGAVRVSLAEGGAFLAGRVHPNGPIAHERNLDYVHKACWGMYASGVDRRLIWRILDWVVDEALQPSGDFYFPEEGPEYQVMQRLYRPLTFLKVAAWIGHPIARDDKVIHRILQYQHSSGGVFNYIGDDPERIEEQESIGSLNTTFFGHLMVALGRREEAVKAGRWILRLVEANKDHMRQGCMYTQMTPEGELITRVDPGEKIAKVVDNRDPKQEFWHVGTCMAYLAVLYEKLREDWSSLDDPEPYLDSALALLRFESSMPLYTYLWPSKCKVGWGAGELLRILVKYGGDIGDIKEAYEVARKVAVFTFMDNQLPSGGWPCMHYPLSELIPEMRYEYKPLKGMVNVPDKPIPGSKTIWLPPEELTGEFLGEMKSIEEGLNALIEKL
ncbi:MAG: hypothetical protein QW176_05625 [Candidatus Bathyarchaeia archaeon]